MRIWLFFFFMAYTNAAPEGDGCTMPDGTPGECKRIHSCPTQFAELRQKGSKAQEYLTALTKHCPLRPHIARNPGVCCTKTATPRTIQKKVWINEPNCGLVDVQKIHGGAEAAVGEFPWMALLGYKIDKEIKFLCGGALIHPRWVLTAAHCINDKLRTVRLGEHDTSKSPDCVQLSNERFCHPEPIDVKIKRVLRHRGYSSQTIVNDIALLELGKPVKYTEEINSICLPVGNAGQINQENLRMTVAGWGRTEDTGVQGSDVLMKLDVPVVKRSRCSEAYKRRPSQMNITSKQMCAGGELHRESCRGDSGGPLMNVISLDGRLRWTLFGVVSYGPKECGSTRVPSVYSQVSKYLQWIATYAKPQSTST